LIHHYNEFITFPIYVWDSHEEEIPPEPTKEPEPTPEGEVNVEESEEAEEVADEPPKPTKKTVWAWDQVNNAKPLWTRPSSEITSEEYSKFFTSMNERQDPLSHSHFKAEGELEFTALIYIPATPPPSVYDFSSLKSNVKLYVKRVFISDRFDDLLPSYLSFIKGVVDSDDLPLNLSREMLQKSALLKAIHRKLTRKAIQMIQDMADAEDQKPFEEFQKGYHQFLKMGITRDSGNKNRLAKLVRFASLNTEAGKQIGFEKYIENMKEGQNSIYYFGGDDEASMRKSPLLERAAKKGIDVLLFTAPIDEYMATSLGQYEKVKLVDISKGGLQLEGDSNPEELAETFKPLVTYLGETLKAVVQRVELSTRLTSTPCALVSAQWGMSSNMERIARAQALQEGYATKAQKKILEINPRHPIIKKLLATVEGKAQNEETAEVARLLVDSAALHSGVSLEDPLTVASRLDKVIAQALAVDPEEQAEEEVIETLPPKAPKAEGETKKSTNDDEDHPATEGITIDAMHEGEWKVHNGDEL